MGSDSTEGLLGRLGTRLISQSADNITLRAHGCGGGGTCRLPEAAV